MVNVAVIMSTYNGEKYIEEQMDSLLGQKNVNLDVWVRDDGSSDATKNLLKVYEKDARVHCFFGTNIGVGNSFMELLYQIPETYDYYCFSDQDDIWLEKKLEIAIDKMKGKKSPVLYTSNQILIDKNGNRLGRRHVYEPDITYMQIINQNSLAGCTMVWNCALFCLLHEETRRPNQSLLKNRIHDVWVAAVASIVGEIIYDTNGYILYRQHENNVVGVRKVNYTRAIVEKLKNPEQQQGRSKLCRELLEKFSDQINDFRIKKDLYLFSHYQDSFKMKCKLMRRKDIAKYSHEREIALILKIMFGLF